MKTHNAENERIKRKYIIYLKEAKRHSEQTVDAVAMSLARFEKYNGMKDFKAFNFNQAIAFKNHLAEQRAKRSGEKLSKATLHATLANLKRFFHWLAGQPGYKSRFQYSDADYFKLPENDVRVATAKREQKSPTLEQVKYVISQMPTGTDVERRDRALMAFTILTGARDSAITSVKLKHVNLQDGSLYQDAREVRTKFAKTFTTTFFPVGEEIRAIVEDWICHLRDDLLWGNDDPLFPATRVAYDQTSGQFRVAGLDRKGWGNATPIRKAFRIAFEGAGLPYFHPHSFRHTLVQLGEVLCPNPEAFKAWSQNLGHEKVLTTFYSYGEVAPRRQGEIMRQLARPQAASQSSADEIADAVLRKMKAAGNER